MNRNWFLIAIAVVLASILIPFMQVNSFAGNVVDSEVVYRDGWFGPYIERVTLGDGAVMHVTQYPWYYFVEGSLSSMNICGIEGSGEYNSINIVCYPDDDPIPIVVKHQNDLDFTNTINWFWDNTEICDRSRLVMYNGIVTNPDEELDPIWDVQHDIAWSYGPYAYGEYWTSTLHYYPYVRPYAHSEGFTVEETLYPTTLVGYDMDRAWVYVTVLERVIHVDPDDPTSPVDPDDPIVVRGTGSINVKIMDNYLQSSATIRMYKDNNLVQSSLYIDNGDYTFDDLEFGTYRFEVIDADYYTYFYDAFPQQAGYDYDLGNVELSAELNTVGYVIYGDFPSTDGSGFDAGDGLLPDWSDNPTSETIDDITDILHEGGSAENTTLINYFFENIISGGDGDDDGSLTLSEIITMIGALLASMGLLTSVAIIGLPIFIVGILFLLGVAFVGSKQTNYSPGNKSGGRK